MKNDLLGRLYEDHGRFGRFFQAIEEQCVCCECGKPVDRRRLEAICTYLGECLPPHHALEDDIFAQLGRKFPGFRDEIFDLLEDHQIGRREFKIFASTVEMGNGGFAEAARSFVANERGHFIAEEETVFRYAAKYLGADQWHALRESAPVLSLSNGRRSGEFAAIEDLLV